MVGLVGGGFGGWVGGRLSRGGGGCGLDSGFHPVFFGEVRLVMRCEVRVV